MSVHIEFIIFTQQQILKNIKLLKYLINYKTYFLIFDYLTIMWIINYV